MLGPPTVTTARKTELLVSWPVSNTTALATELRLLASLVRRGRDLYVSLMHQILNCNAIEQGPCVSRAANGTVKKQVLQQSCSCQRCMVQ